MKLQGSSGLTEYSSEASVRVSAERRPESELSTPPFRSDQKNVRDVPAGHEEKEPDSARQDEKTRPDIAHHLIEESRHQRHELGAGENGSRGLPGELLDEVRGDGAEVVRRGLECRSLLQPGDGAVAELTERLALRIELERNPDVDVLERKGEARG